MSQERFDIIADAFYRVSGVMAPGKDAPMGLSQPTHGVRTELFRQWMDTNGDAVEAMYQACRSYWRIEDD